MKSNAIIYRYIFGEMIPPFLINLTFITFVFLMVGLLDLTHLIVNYGADFWSILFLLIYSMPFFLEFVIPMSTMLAILLSFLRMSADNEIVALAAGGRSVYELLPPVLLFCLLGAVLTGFMAIYGLPEGRIAFRELSKKVALTSFDAALKEKTFNDSFEGVVLYINRIDFKTRTFEDVFIEDKRRPGIRSTVVAPSGRLHKRPGQPVFILSLSNGSIHQVDADQRTAQSIRFDTYDIHLRLPNTEAAGAREAKDEEEMSLSELRQYLADQKQSKDAQYYLTLMEYHKKLSLPAACFALGLLALPLGLRAKSSRRSFGVGLGLICFLVYYLLLSLGWAFGESGQYPPLVGMWVPNAIVGGLGLLLILKAGGSRFGIRGRHG